MKTTKNTLAAKIASALAAATIGLALVATPAVAMADEMDDLVPYPYEMPDPTIVLDPYEAPEPTVAPDPVIVPDPIVVPEPVVIPEPIPAPIEIPAPLWVVEDAWDVTLDTDDGWVPVESALDTFYVVFQDDYMLGSSWATPREQLRAILVALRHARLTTSASVVVGVDPCLQDGVRLVDVTLVGRGLRYIYTVEAATGHIARLSIQ